MLDKKQAQRLTQQIKANTSDYAKLIKQAWEKKVWLPLGPVVDVMAGSAAWARPVCGRNSNSNSSMPAIRAGARRRPILRDAR